MELFHVVRKLVGPIEPVGETREDERRLENLKAMTFLVDTLLCDISSVALQADRQEHSMKIIGLHAKKFLHDVRDAD